MRPCPTGHWKNPDPRDRTLPRVSKRLPFCVRAGPVPGSGGAVPGQGRWSAALKSQPQTHRREILCPGSLRGAGPGTALRPFPINTGGQSGRWSGAGRKSEAAAPSRSPEARAAWNLGLWGAGVEREPFSAAAPGRRLPGHPPQPRTARAGRRDSLPGLRRWSAGTRRGENGRVG